MGYSEVVCHLCGVSFNIGRVRLLHEPMTDGWDCSGGSYVCGRTQTICYGDRDDCAGDYVDEYGKRHRDGQDIMQTEETSVTRTSSKCLFVDRFLQEQRELPQWQKSSIFASDGDGDLEMADATDDEDFNFDERSASDVEPLEYDSDANDSESDSSARRENSPRQAWFESFCVNTYQHDRFLNSNRASTSLQAWYSPPQRPASYFHQKEGDPRLAGSASRFRLEHIAGTDCDLDDAYNGHLISAAEMKGCTTLQCLVQKQPGRPFSTSEQAFEEIANGLHEPFELVSDFFLSGLCSHSTSPDTGIPHKFFPQRHRNHCDQLPHRHIDQPDPSNYLFVEDDVCFSSMPFHPACLEVYKRISKHDKRYGHGNNTVDAIRDLTSWWLLDAALKNMGRRRFAPDVQACSKQWWLHKRGTEYLAANPLFVPNLPSILHSAVSDDLEFDVQRSAFPVALKSFACSTHAFCSLPQELREMLLSYLSSRDIANLRLASHAFHQLPVILFHELIRREMPWLWEAWTEHDPATTPYSCWASIDPIDIKSEIEEHEHQRRAAADYVQLVAEGYPEQRDDLLRRRHDWEMEYSQEWAARYFRSETPIQLPLRRTNWYKLYCDITRHWAELKGLKNRSRIWADCENILHEIAEYRDRGELPVTNIPRLFARGRAD